MSDSQWLDYIVETILRMYEQGCSDNQIRFFATDDALKRGLIKRNGRRDSSTTLGSHQTTR